MATNNKGSIIVFAPHADDETLGCGGVIVKRLREGFKVKLVVMTDGSNSHSTAFNMYSDPHPRKLAEIRKMEVFSAARTLGICIENILFLGYEDGSLETNVNDAIGKIKNILSNESDLMELYVTHELDRHKDHRATGLIVRNTISQLGLAVPVYSYVIWHSKKQRDYGFAIREHIEDTLLLKAKAIDQYKTQIKLFSNWQKMPVLSHEFVTEFKTRPVEEFWVWKEI